MACADCVHAVLTDWQLKPFCALFQVTPAELEANFAGCQKHVLLSRDLAFLFPRAPSLVAALQRELAVYEAFARLDAVPLPKLVRRVADPLISYYEFGAVTRLRGVPFSQLIGTLSAEQFETFLFRLAELIAVWHSLPTNDLPGLLLGDTGAPEGSATADAWPGTALNLKTVEEAVESGYDFVRRAIHPRPLPEGLAQEATTKQRWRPALEELARLSPVLVHTDLHEGNLLVDPQTLEITGVFDWAGARVGNPVRDFWVSEWGIGIAQWWGVLPRLRRRMWQHYLQARGMTASAPEGLNLYYLLWDLIWTVQRPWDRHATPTTGMDYEAGMAIYVEQLEAVTRSL